MERIMITVGIVGFVIGAILGALSCGSPESTRQSSYEVLLDIT